MKFLELYRSWQIYLIPEAYAASIQGKLTGQLIDRYIAIEPISHRCIDDLTSGSIKAQIDEVNR
jgi:hypothetical protein